MGVTEAIAKLAPDLTGKPAPDDLASLQSEVARYAQAGFRIAGLEGDQFDMRRIKLGLPGRDEDLDRYRAMLINMGRCGIELLCYNFMPLGWLRNRTGIETRGGALVTGYRHDPHDHGDGTQISTEQMWANYAYFLQAVLPAAEAAGVTMALHPDDPPVPVVRGIARIFTSAEAAERADGAASGWRTGQAAPEGGNHLECCWSGAAVAAAQAPTRNGSAIAVK